jgi:ABC-2 type transport system permease protein
MVSYGVAGFFFWNSLNDMDYAVRQGTFDSILIYPINPLYHLCLRSIALQNIGNFILGGVVFAYCFQKLQIIWSAPKVIWFILIICSGSLIQFSLMVLVAASSFWLKRTYGVHNLTFAGLKNFVDYPIKIYDVGVQGLLTFIIPYAFVNFYPAQYFLDKSDDYLFHPLLQFAAPLVGLIFFFITYQIWKQGLKRYESTGS